MCSSAGAGSEADARAGSGADADASAGAGPSAGVSSRLRVEPRQRFGGQELSERDGVGVAAGPRVSLVEQQDHGALARGGSEKPQRRAVLRLEGTEGPGRGAQRAEDDRDARRADAPCAKELVAERGVAIACAEKARSGGPSRRELALDGVVDRVGKSSAERRADAFELDHNHPRQAERAAFGVALDRLREGQATRVRRGRRRGRRRGGHWRERPGSRVLSDPGVVHGSVDAGRKPPSTASCSHALASLAQFLAALTDSRPMLSSESFPLQVRDCRLHMDPEQPRTRGAMSAR
jgi:hypothetical protein